MNSTPSETPRSSPTATRTLRVHRLERVAPQVLLVELRDPNGEALPPAEPGAHIDVHLPDGALRSYSLCGDPVDRQAYRIAVLNVPGGRGSHFIHGELESGAALTVALPRNSFRFDRAPRYLFIAGGIGITPLLPMVRAAADRGADWTLHYCVRNAAAAPFLDELLALPHGRVELHAADEGRRLAVDALLASTPADALIYCCGPQRLMEAVAAATPPTHDARFEWFTAPAEAARGNASDGGGADDSFEVVCARSGVTVTVAAGTSILEALDAAGVPVDSSCEQGICGTCETTVLEGQPDHRDSVLSKAERAAGKTMMLCVSRALSARVVLDV